MRSLPAFFYPHSLAFLLFFCVHADASASEAAPQGRQDQIQAIESKLSKEKQKFEAYHYEEKDLMATLAEIEREVSDKRTAVEKLGAKIRKASKETEQMNERLAELESESNKLEAAMSQRLVIMYQYARQGTFKVLANARDLNQFWRRARYLRAILEEDRRTMLALAEQQAAVQSEISELQQEMVRKKAAQEEQEKQLSAVKQELDQKVIRLMRVHKEKEFYQTAVKELESAAKDLRQAVRKAETRPTYDGAPAGRLSDAKGKLPAPMEGDIIVSDKFSAAAGVKGGKGVLITGPSDSAVRAVFPGRVDFSGGLKGYGEVIIINHGSRYFSISAHLSERIKQEGDLVEGGETIGWVRSKKKLGKPWLYFEMREGEKPLDVLTWLREPRQAQR
jgi:septal ring factor EnvC (AmiA/AmiB activator)